MLFNSIYVDGCFGIIFFEFIISYVYGGWDIIIILRTRHARSFGYMYIDDDLGSGFGKVMMIEVVMAVEDVVNAVVDALVVEAVASHKAPKY